MPGVWTSTGGCSCVWPVSNAIAATAGAGSGEAAENVGLDVVLPRLVDLRHLLVEREVRIRDRILADDVGEVVDRMRAVHPRAAGVGPARERDHVEGVLARDELREAGAQRVAVAIDRERGGGDRLPRA